MLDKFLISSYTSSLLPIKNVVEEEPGLYPGEANGHLHRHGLDTIVHLGHLQHPHFHVDGDRGSLQLKLAVDH